MTRQAEGIQQAVKKLKCASYSQEIEQMIVTWDQQGKQKQLDLEQLQNAPKTTAMLAAENHKVNSELERESKLKEREQLRLKLNQLREELQGIQVRRFLVLSC